VILVEPDHVFYGRVTVADVPEIVQGLAEGRIVERLIVRDADMEGPRKVEMKVE
jgi:(2Fe-2S) ferredoxin